MLALGIGIVSPFSGWTAAGKIGTPEISEMPTPERPLQNASGRHPA
jgi:hypothetical protein